MATAVNRTIETLSDLELVAEISDIDYIRNLKQTCWWPVKIVKWAMFSGYYHTSSSSLGHAIWNSRWGRNVWDWYMYLHPRNTVRSIPDIFYNDLTQLQREELGRRLRPVIISKMDCTTVSALKRMDEYQIEHTLVPIIRDILKNMND